MTNEGLVPFLAAWPHMELQHKITTQLKSRLVLTLVRTVLTYSLLAPKATGLLKLHSCFLLTPLYSAYYLFGAITAASIFLQDLED